MVELTQQSGNVGSTSSINRQALNSSLERLKAAWPGLMLEAHDTLFSGVAISIAPAQLEQMKGVIAAVEKIVALPAWQQEVMAGTPEKFTPKNPGVFFGYDFHLNAQGAHLIEINTNAGGAFLSELFHASQQGVDLGGTALALENLPHELVAMFRREWLLQRGSGTLHTIAIVDEAPASQYFYPEFVLAKQLFDAAGIRTLIADPSEFAARADGLYLGDAKVDLIYNRLTDFSLQQFPLLLSAYQKNQVVLTPHPHAYALYADKRNLTLMTDAARLRAMGVDEVSIATLQAGVPQTRLVERKDEEQWWTVRKDWFFKPATGYGGRGSYRGDKLTRRVFGEIVQGGYVAQRKAIPGEVMVSLNDTKAAFKYDVRCYVYEGQIQLVMARLYQGQTTNFRTPGGGFALVLLEP